MDIFEKKTELEKKILYGLSCEWELAVNEIEYQYSVVLKRPSFSLENFSALGKYFSERNEIVFSRDFVFSFPWYAIRDVLLHEIAHQLDFCYFKYVKKPHGENFKTACEILNADPSAKGYYKNLESHEKSELDSNDKIMIKVKKLLALAASCNKNEAESAMQKAHHLISKYNIDLIKGSEKQDYRTIFLDKPALRHFREYYHLTSLLTDHYFVEGIWVSAFVVDKEKIGKVFEISGTEQNLKISEYVYGFVKKYIDSRWSEYKKNRKLNRYRKTDFAIGIIEGFRSKLEKKNESDYGEIQTGLIPVEDSELTGYFNKRYPKQRTITKKGSMHNKNIMDDGYSIGKELVISKAIEEKNVNEDNKLLE